MPKSSPDPARAVPDDAALRQFSKHSKENRSDQPQVVIAMAVTKEGIPVRCWTFPGRTSDQLVTRRIKDGLGSWMLNRVVWVTDSGFNSATNRAYLQRGGDHYIVCEKLRAATTDVKAALSRPGRYHLVEGNLSVKEARVGDGAGAEHFCVCVNPEAKRRYEIVRASLVAYLEKRIEASDEWSKQRRDELVGELRQTPGLARFLRRTKDHLLRIDKAAIAKDAHFDGVRTLCARSLLGRCRFDVGGRRATDVAGALGVARSAISNWESARRSPSGTTLVLTATFVEHLQAGRRRSRR